MNARGIGLGLWEEPQSQLAKWCNSQGDKNWEGFILQLWARASSLFSVGTEALYALAATREAGMWPSSTPTEEVWK